MTDDFAAAMNENPTGYNRAMGLRFVSASGDGVVAEWQVGEQHLQPYGIVHGGVYSGAVETVCSVGAALSVLSRGQGVVGLENQTTFLKAVRSGRLRVTAQPLLRGRRTQVWQADVVNEAGELVASGRVRLLCLEADAAIAGQAMKIDGGASES